MCFGEQKQTRKLWEILVVLVQKVFLSSMRERFPVCCSRVSGWLCQVLLHHVLKGSQEHGWIWQGLSPVFSMVPRCQDTTRLQAGTTLMTEAAGGMLSLTNGSICRSDTAANMIGKDPLHISLAPFFAGQILITQNLGSK